MSTLASQPVRRSQRIAAQKAALSSSKASKKAALPADTKAYRTQLNQKRIDALITASMERAVRFRPRGTPTIEYIQWYSYIMGPLLAAVANPHADFTKVDHEALYHCMAFWAEDARDIFIYKTMTPDFLYNWNKCCNLLENIGFHY
jgi:hypothetical protein